MNRRSLKFQQRNKMFDKKIVKKYISFLADQKKTKELIQERQDFWGDCW